MATLTVTLKARPDSRLCREIREAILPLSIYGNLSVVERVKFVTESSRRGLFKKGDPDSREVLEVHYVAYLPKEMQEMRDKVVGILKEKIPDLLESND